MDTSPKGTISYIDEKHYLLYLIIIVLILWTLIYSLVFKNKYKLQNIIPFFCQYVLISPL